MSHRPRTSTSTSWRSWVAKSDGGRRGGPVVVRGAVVVGALGRDREGLRRKLGGRHSVASGCRGGEGRVYAFCDSTKEGKRVNTRWQGVSLTRTIPALFRSLREAGNLSTTGSSGPDGRPNPFAYCGLIRHPREPRRPRGRVRRRDCEGRLEVLVPGRHRRVRGRAGPVRGRRPAVVPGHGAGQPRRRRRDGRRPRGPAEAGPGRRRAPPRANSRRTRCGGSPASPCSASRTARRSPTPRPTTPRRGPGSTGSGRCGGCSTTFRPRSAWWATPTGRPSPRTRWACSR